MQTDLKEKKRKARFLVIIGIIVASVPILGGMYYFKHNEIRVIQSTHDNGMDKEAWIFRKDIFGKKQKIKAITYFKNGRKESEVNYKKDQVNGWARMWYENGQLQLEATYKNNKTHGVRNAYHENGQIFCRAEYENGKLLRKKNWDEKGNEIYLPLDRD